MNTTATTSPAANTAPIRHDLNVADVLQALSHSSQRLVEDIQLFAALFVGRPSGTAGTFSLNASRAPAPQQAEVLFAYLSEPTLQVLQ